MKYIGNKADYSIIVFLPLEALTSFNNIILAALSHSFKLDVESEETKQVITKEFSILTIQQFVLAILSLSMYLIWMCNLEKKRLGRLFVIITVLLI